ncbi:unnamed protein product [Protopolystoma xenopodis]|uniref:Uncharacterized protein n=1 Tax=Protopolystoma xenopodis TaxID=117903 RepID=A0A3S5CBG3_9PLAT|nr:unnamed protein product [Protopolystoma xenopodis]
MFASIIFFPLLPPALLSNALASLGSPATSCVIPPCSSSSSVAISSPDPAITTASSKVADGYFSLASLPSSTDKTNTPSSRISELPAYGLLGFQVPRLAVQLLAAPMAGISAAVIINPIDCIRVRMQAKGWSKGFVDWPHRISQEGCLGLLSVELCEENLDLPSYYSGDSVLSFRRSCDGHRPSQKPLFTKNTKPRKVAS